MKNITLITLLIIASHWLGAQNLAGYSASGSGSTSSSSFSDVAGASIEFDVTGVNHILVISTFQCEMTSSDATYRAASYRIADKADPVSINSGVIQRSLSNPKSTDYGIGSQVYIFDVSSYSGTRIYSLQHSLSTPSRTLITSATIAGIALKSGDENLVCKTTQASSSSEITGEWTEIAGTNTGAFTTIYSGGFYASASVQIRTSVFDTEASGEWNIQYKISASGSWTDLCNSTSRSMYNTSDVGIISKAGTLPDNSIPGDYFFRIIHKKNSGSSASTILTEFCNLVVVSLGTVDGYYSVLSTSGNATTSNSTLGNAITGEMTPGTSTPLFLHSVYSISASAETNSPVFDLYINNDILDGGDQKRYLSSSNDHGNGASVGISSTLTATQTYQVSLRHASASGNLLTSQASLVGFALNLDAGQLPVNLHDFNGSLLSDNRVLLNWTTSAEINNDKFEILCSNNAVNWIKSGEVDGNGNSNSIIQYTFIDNPGFSGTVYYKLKQIDFNGEFEMSGIIAVNTGDVFINDFVVYPNPASNILYVMSINNQDDGSVNTYKLYDIAGTFVGSGILSNEDIPLIQLNESISPGNYIIVLYQNGNEVMRKMFQVIK